MNNPIALSLPEYPQLKIGFPAIVYWVTNYQACWEHHYYSTSCVTI